MNKKIKQFISKGLIISTLIVNVSSSSLAGILSDDTRYEKFEGSDIVINDILEEDKVDVEIEGNTLVNLSYDIFETAGDAILSQVKLTEDLMEATISREGSVVGMKKASLKDNTVYTLICEIKTNLDHIRYSFKNNESYLQGSISDYADYSKEYKKVVAKITTTKDCTHIVIGRHGVLEVGTYLNIKNLILLEGDWTNREIPECFKGMKSVGQDDADGHKIEILSRNKNLFIEDVVNQTGSGYLGNGKTYPSMFNDNATRCRSANPIKVKPSTTYYFSSNNKFYFAIAEFDKDNRQILENGWTIPPEGGKHTTSQHCRSIVLIIKKADNTNLTPEDIYGNIQIEESNTKTAYSAPNTHSKEIILNEPLRSLPNGTKDKIVKKDGKWYIERNCGEVVLNGAENWSIFTSDWVLPNSIVFTTTFKNAKGYTWTTYKGNESISNKVPSYGDNELRITDTFGYTNDNTGGAKRFRIPKSYLSSETVQGCKEWFANNNVSVIYELKTPFYESINFNSFPLYLDTTHVSNDSLIPANMKATVDRIANRAEEYGEIAKLNPTVENMSQARYWINLMKDSILKDKFQEDVNSIIQIEDLEIEKKIVSANVDLYIESENTLSMSLSTNSIIFDDYTGTDELELLKAVDVVVSSSLPYDLNVYMPNGIYNADKSNSMDINVLKIKTNEETQYKSFVSTNDKIVLKNNCTEGENLIHSIDLKLSGGNTYKADVYKTVLKFEVEQK